MRLKKLSIVWKNMEYKFNFYKDPFHHWIIDNFFPTEVSEKIFNSFLDYGDTSWWNYNTPLENKKTIQDWRKFPPEIYKTFQYLCSPKFIDIIKKITGIEVLYPDYGLHGGGLHIHGRGGNLNVHKDYSIHPRLNLQRKLNLIVYMTPDWDQQWGGELELWSHSVQNNRPERMTRSIQCIFNRAVLFDTTQNSWHGLPKPLNCPENQYRRSLAVYYLTDKDEKTEDRYRALFVPREDQNTNEIIELCKTRSMNNYDNIF